MYDKERVSGWVVNKSMAVGYESLFSLIHTIQTPIFNSVWCLDEMLVMDW